MYRYTESISTLCSSREHPRETQTGWHLGSVAHEAFEISTNPQRVDLNITWIIDFV